MERKIYSAYALFQAILAFANKFFQSPPGSAGRQTGFMI
jgi:hypothetical protein